MPPTPHNLYLLTARLLREGRVTLEGIASHLSPSDEEIRTTQVWGGGVNMCEYIWTK